MTFTEALKKDGIGYVWLMEVSNDDFATIAHRWSTVACHVGAQRFDPRIVQIGKIAKAFGLDSFPNVTTVALVLDNTAFDMDWLVDVAGGPIEFTYRFRLSLGFYDPNNLNPLIDVEPVTQAMGTFGMLDSPARTNSTVELTLADDAMGRLSQLASSPTINEWIADPGSTVDNNLLVGATNTLYPNVSWDTPLPLVFGSSAVAVLANAGLPSENGGALDRYAHTTGYTHAIVVCVTTSSDAVAASDVLDLNITFAPQTQYDGAPSALAGATITVDPTVTIGTDDPLGRAAGTYNVWSAQKSQGITKDGHTWKVLWVAFNGFAYIDWCAATPGIGAIIGGERTGTNENGDPVYAPVAAGYPYLSYPNGMESAMAAISFTVRGYPFSAQTVKNSQYQAGINVIRDLICFYSAGSSIDIDGAGFDTALQQNSTWVAGVLQPLQLVNGPQPKFLTPIAAAMQPGNLRQVIGDIAQSIGIDVFFTWANLFSVAASWFNFDAIAATHLAIEETRMQDTIRERKPSQGERWTYYNRLYLQGPDGNLYGPYDNQPAIDAVGIAIPRTVVGKWLLPDTSGGDPSYVDGLWQLLPRLESKQRNLIDFTTDREALQLDLGGFFALTWTRGNSQAVYTGAIFRIESISVDPNSLSVDIEAVWVDDIASVNPYLLDDESLTLRVASSGGRTATVHDSSGTVSFSTGDLVADGVTAGDMLILLDTTQAENVFTRHRALRITAVGSSTSLTVTGDLAFDAPSGVAVANWTIVRGKTTYPNVGSDPTHYPSGSAMYGKVSSSSGVFSDSTSGNQLLDG